MSLLRNRTQSTSDQGRAGEDAAVEYLKNKGYSIVARNRMICGAEVDIIAQYEDCLCFIEVKSRGEDSAGSPFEYVDRKKQKGYFRAAEVFCSDDKYQDYFIRFDIIAVYTDRVPPGIDHLEEAFWRDG